MSLDAPTLTFAGGLSTFVSGIFLLVYWFQDRTAWSAFWWAMGSCDLGSGSILLSLHDVLLFFMSIIIALQILNLSSILALAAALIFNRRSVNPYRLAIWAVVWLAIDVVAGISWPEQFAVTMGVGISG